MFFKKKYIDITHIDFNLLNEFGWTIIRDNVDFKKFPTVGIMSHGCIWEYPWICQHPSHPDWDIRLDETDPYIFVLTDPDGIVYRTRILDRTNLEKFQLFLNADPCKL